MVSYQKLKHVVGDKLLVEAVCLSTDTKPTDNIADSSKLTEQDTGKKYLFNSGTWYYIAENVIEIEEPTLITLTEDTDVIGLATKAYNGEVLVQWYADSFADVSIPVSPPILFPCSPLVIPMDANNPFIIGFATSFIYVCGKRPDYSLAIDMRPAVLACVLRSTPQMHITKDDATVCGTLEDMSASSFRYLSIEDFSEQYMAPKFLITPLYSKQQQTHPALFVAPAFTEYNVDFYDGEMGNWITSTVVEEGMQVDIVSIPVGYDYWTYNPEYSGSHLSYDDITSMFIDQNYSFYGWRKSTIWLGDGATGNGLYQGQYVNGSVLPYNDIVNAVPSIAEYTHWFTDIDHNVPVDDITTEIINGNTNYFGWVGDPNEKTGGE